MKAQLKAGAEIDLLSADEYRQEQEKLRKEIGKDRVTIETFTAIQEVTWTASQSTQEPFPIYQVRPGFKATLHRLLVGYGDIYGAIPGTAPFPSSSYIFRNEVSGQTMLTALTCANVNVAMYESGSRSAPALGTADTLVAVTTVFASSEPAGGFTTVFYTGQVALMPIDTP